MSTRVGRAVSLILLGCAVAAPAVLAGSVNISWNPSSGATGYRILYGTSAGQLTNSVDVGNATTTTVGNLADCTTWYFAARAYNSAGESASSTVVSSWPRPTIASVNPNSGVQGTQVGVTLTGSNLQGGSTVALSGSGVTVSGVNVSSCTQLSATLTLSGSAATTARNVSVTNASGVTGTTTGLFTVQSQPATPPPTVPNVRRTDILPGA